MPNTVQLQTITTPQLTAVVRRLATKPQLPKVIPEACGIVWNALRAANVKGGRHVALYLDNEMNLEVGAEVDAPFAGHGEVIGSSLPTGRVATATHFGAYNQLDAAQQAIHDWCKQNGHSLAGVSWEIYGHWEDRWNNDPSQIRTDVYYLLKS
jgi:effector-binding domain-containing protein